MIPFIISIIFVILLFSIFYFTRSKSKGIAELYIENSTSAFIAIDKNETTVIYNQTAEDLIGIPKKEVLGKPFNELLKKSLDTYDSILLNTLRNGLVYQHIQAVMDTSAGPLHVMAYTDLLKDWRGKITGSLLCIRDVSDQKQLEEQIFQTEKFDLIGEIAAGIANEVRNPLTSIHGLLQLLESKLSPEKATDAHVNIMLEEIQQLNRIISEFLLMSRPVVPIRREADLHNILDDALLQSDDEILNKNITVNRLYDKKLPKVYLDTEQINRVFLNIISNALNAMNDGGQLEVRTDYMKDNCSFTITFTDNGCGMNHHTFDRIFEPFFTTRSDCTGLGLTVSKRIIDNHGGKIEVHSKSGQGSSFIIILPLIDETEMLPQN